MAKKRSKRAAAPSDTAKGSADDAGGRAAAAASASAEGREAENEGADEGAQVTESRRVQKRAAKQMRLMDNLRRTQTLIAAARGDSKTKKASKKKKGAVSNLPTSLTLDTLASALGDALPDALTLTKEADKRHSLLSAKQRGKIVVEETKQMAAVLSHPAFKADPFAAIQQHLSNTLPSSVAAPPLPTKFATRQAQQALEKKKRKKKGKKKSGGHGGEGAMEM
ncbi:hypothetical protein CLOM_g5595 [Closterium sp. NIES-68]|nr:hypothetical protein CLOM_g5595 [Closterium sp. NIES-68]GJP74736.1 hypothetical protein CLOP_g5277 [Closterium sp. NIES-67]